MKKTLARCRKFKDTGKTCFNDPALRDIILAASPRGNHTEPGGGFGSEVKSNMPHGASNFQHDPGASGLSSFFFPPFSPSCFCMTW